MSTQRVEKPWQRELQEHRERASGGADAEQYRTFNYEVAQTLAPTWEARRAEIEDTAASVRDWLVRETAAEPGDTVLELAAGVGDTGFELAKVVGEHGRLISTDFSPAMVEAARRRGDELGIRNVDYRVVDAERIELEADSVDRVVCRYGYMLMADVAAALTETRRVLRPDGRLALAVWGAPERNPFLMLPAAILVERGHLPPPDPEGPGIFSMASEERTRALLAASGFGDVRVEELSVRFHAASTREYLSFVSDTAGPIAMALRALPDDELERVAARLDEALAPFAAEGAYELPGVTLAAVAS
jgi:ubiquinone/menaquinone biosynthesis C-methylase UbiE